MLTTARRHGVAPTTRHSRRRGAGLLRGAVVFATALLAIAPAAGTASATASPRAHVAQGCVNADTRVTDASAQAIRSAVVCLLNHQRTGRHLPALGELRRLDHSAQRWTDVMVANGVFDHVARGSDPGSRISAAGFPWSSIGENLAAGFPTPRSVVAAWMGSQGHCQNILSPKFRYVGEGVSAHHVRGVSNGPTWTTDFGLPAHTSAPSHNSGPASHCPY